MTKKVFSIFLVCMLLLAFLNMTATITSAAPPTGFDKYQSNIPNGTVTTITYHSKTANADRKAMIYTPPGYSTSQKYSVLYLMPGIGGDETEWYKNGSPNVILDNLYSQNKLAPMIVVFPNCKIGTDTSGLDTFQNDLINDLIPYIDSHYPVLTSPENRALAGLSSGGGQAMNFGLKYMSTFANVGGFSPGYNTNSPSTIAPNPSQVAKNIKVLWISAGDQDAALSIAQGLHDYFTKNNVPHTFYHAPGGHDWPIWKDSLYQFSQLIFKGNTVPTPTPTSIYTPIPTPTPRLTGDVDGDGKVNSTDVSIERRVILGAYFGNAPGSDVNKDGKVNSTDYSIVKRIVLGTYTAS